MNSLEGQIPGGVLKNVVKEHRFMEEFEYFLRQRLELDEKYHQDLAALCNRSNPRWKDSTMHSLLSPILTFFTEEMQTRRATCESIKNILDGLPVVDSPDKLREERSMLNEYQRLIEINESLQQCRQTSTSIDSIIEMQSWLDKEAPESGHGDPGKFTDITGLNQDQMRIFRLPETDRIYRQSVGSQQRVVREVLEWHNNTFPDVLERHQDQCESMKNALRQIGNAYSDLASQIVEQLSMAKDALEAFSSSQWISAKHEDLDLEAIHEYLRPAPYVNVVTGSSSKVVVYGLELDQVSLWGPLKEKVNSLLSPSHRSWESTLFNHPLFPSDNTCSNRLITFVGMRNALLAHYVPSKQFALDLEQQLDDHNYDSIFNSLSRLEVFSMASFYLLTSSPLVSLSDINIDLYNGMENHIDLNKTSSRIRNIDSTDKPVAALSRKVTSVFQRNPSFTASKKKESRDQIMESILYRVPNEYRKQVGELILLWRCKLLEEDDTVALTQIVGSQSILEDMIKKWDFDLWRPLPTGVERRRTVEGDWVVS